MISFKTSMIFHIKFWISLQLHVQVSISYFKYLFFSENSFFSNMSLQSLFVHYIKQDTKCHFSNECLPAAGESGAFWGIPLRARPPVSITPAASTCTLSASTRNQGAWNGIKNKSIFQHLNAKTSKNGFSLCISEYCLIYIKNLP